MGLVNKISILGSSGKIFIIDLISHQFEAEIGAEMAPFSYEIVRTKTVHLMVWDFRNCFRLVYC